MHVKFLSDSHIERAAETLLTGYGVKFGAVTKPPVPVDEILESHLGLSLDFDDMLARVEQPGVLGAIWVEDKQVIIDLTLDPKENPRHEGRYRFTVAHETGHWVLHRTQLLENRAAPLFSGKPAPSLVCRDSGKKPPIEIQADKFAGYLLMPTAMVRQQWAEATGSSEPMVVEDEIKGMAERLVLPEGVVPTARISKHLADKFHVSGQAMQIRLVALGLVLTKKPPPSLFG
jgi:hypothetical protein